MSVSPRGVSSAFVRQVCDPGGSSISKVKEGKGVPILDLGCDRRSSSDVAFRREGEEGRRDPRRRWFRPLDDPLVWTKEEMDALEIARCTEFKDRDGDRDGGHGTIR